MDLMIPQRLHVNQNGMVLGSTAELALQSSSKYTHVHWHMHTRHATTKTVQNANAFLLLTDCDRDRRCFRECFLEERWWLLFRLCFLSSSLSSCTLVCRVTETLLNMHGFLGCWSSTNAFPEHRHKATHKNTHASVKLYFEMLPRAKEPQFQVGIHCYIEALIRSEGSVPQLIEKTAVAGSR